MTSTIPYRPSNSSEGADFEAKFCDRCEYNAQAKENEDLCGCCDILANALAFSICDHGFPQAWVSDPDGSNPRCTRFRELGTGTWEQVERDRRRYEQAMAEMRAAR